MRRSSALGQLIGRMNQLAILGCPKEPSRGVLVPFLQEREEPWPYFEAWCPLSAKRGSSCYLRSYKEPEPGLRCSSLSCPQEDQRHRSGQTGPPAPGQRPGDPRPPRMNPWRRNPKPQSEGCDQGAIEDLLQKIGAANLLTIEVFFYSMHFTNVR